MNELANVDSNRLSWDQYISEFTSKAVGTIEILRRDLSFALRYTRTAAYEILVKSVCHPHL